jgi:hypothetical protein
MHDVAIRGLQLVLGLVARQLYNCLGVLVIPFGILVIPVAYYEP